MMKQDPILPSTDVLNKAAPTKRMLPPLVITNRGSMVGDGLVAVILHGLCILIVFWCMHIPKHHNPLDASVVAVAFEAPTEPVSIPTEPSELPNIMDQQSLEVFESAPETETLPVTQSFAKIESKKPIKMVQPKQDLVMKPLKISEGVKSNNVVTHENSQSKGIVQEQNLNISSQSQKAVGAILSMTQRCRALSKEYPMPARRRHEEGTAIIGYQLLADGQIKNVEVVESSGFFDLDRAAVKAVQNIKCQAASGQPVITTSMSVNFSLNKKN